MSAHAYWRLRNAANDGDNAQLAEVYFRDASDNDLCVGGSVIYSSQYNGSNFAAANGFDRNNATGYANLGFMGEWVGYHFPSPVEVDNIRIIGSAAFPALNPKAISIDVSDDGVTWRPYYTFWDSAGNMTAGQSRVFDIVHPSDLTATDGGSPHRYWRVRPAGNKGTNGQQIIARIKFFGAGGVAGNIDTTVVYGGSPIESDHETTWYNTFPFARTYSFGWQSLASTNNRVGSWVGWDFGAGNEQVITGVLLASYNLSSVPWWWYVEYSDDNITWKIRDRFSLTWTSGSFVERTVDFAAVSLTAEYTFDYSIAAQDISKTYSFDYEIEGAVFTTTFDFDYRIDGQVNFTFDYQIELYKTFQFNYKISGPTGDRLGYLHIFPGDHGPKRAVATVITGATVGEGLYGDPGAVTYPVSVPLPDAEVRIHYHFYADYYNRIWVSPSDIRLSNPKIGFEYSFYIWNAYDRPNDLINYAPTDVDGTSFVEFDDMPISFNPVEIKEMHFTIDEDAPSQIQGRMDFIFDMGSGGFTLFALVLGVLRTLPNEPFNEKWTWYTAIETSMNGTEQRQAFRDEPRTQAGYQVMLLDDDDRRVAYQQLFNFATRSVLVPFFQYVTGLTADAPIGATRLYFDLSRSDVRAGEYLVLFHPQTYQFELLQIASLNTDGVMIMTPLTIDADMSTWEVVPARSMRLPNKSALGMEALTGELMFKGESTTWRALKRPSSAVTLPTYEGFPVLPYKPIAQNLVDETFDSDVEVIDNDSAPPELRSTFTNPFIEGTKEYLIDRDTEMDWWRTFFDYTKGMMRPFLVPTWRDDLPLVEQPELGDNELVTSNTDYADYFQYNTYKYVQISSDAGVIYRMVEDASYDDLGIRISLNDPIGLTPGSNENMVVSFLNITRLNDDEVFLEHSINHTLIQIKTRTVNQ